MCGGQMRRKGAVWRVKTKGSINKAKISSLILPHRLFDFTDTSQN